MFGGERLPTIGRYIVRQRIGAGGSGAVYEAHDPQLQRAVAIKLIGTTNVAQRARVTAEARALAQISSPTIVEIFDVAEFIADASSPVRSRRGMGPGACYLVMELIRGESLDTWGAQSGVNSLVDALVSVAGALHSAHIRGIVHGDIKPENIIVQQGQPKIVDWGLAVLRNDDAPILVAAGTARYMAPELHQGSPSAAADQYALCASFRDAFERCGDAVPAGVRAVLSRGLRPRPSERFRDLGALVAAVEPRPRRLRRAIIVTAVLCVAAAGFIGAGSSKDCEAERPAAADVWSFQRRAQMAELFERSSGPESASELVAKIDAHVASWAEAERAACEGGGQVVRAANCVSVSRADLAAALVEVERSEPEAWPWLSTVLGDLQPVECQHHVASEGAHPRERSALVRADVLLWSGRLAEAREANTAAMTGTQAGAPSALHARALRIRGRIDSLDNRPHEARMNLVAAYTNAVKAGSEREACRSAVELVIVLGLDLRDRRAARRWADHARARLLRLGEHRRVARALRLQLVRAEANIAHVHGERDVALKLLESARVEAEAWFGEHSVITASVWSDLAVTESVEGNLALAEQYHRKALRARREVLASTHPEIATSLVGLANIAMFQERYDEAVELLEEALAVYDSSLGNTHPLRGSVLFNLAHIRLLQEDAQAAWDLAAQALPIFQESVGPSHPNTLRCSWVLGLAEFQLGRRTQALERLKQISVAFPDGADPALLAVFQASYNTLLLEEEHW